MSKSEMTILTVMCLVYKDNMILMQKRNKRDWLGYALPGGHVEKEESIVKAVIREIKEETGLTIFEPKLCGLKQFQTEENERYLVLLFKTDKFEGQLASSDEGEMVWIDKDKLDDYMLVKDFKDLLQVFEQDYYTEFVYEKSDKQDKWLVKLY